MVPILMKDKTAASVTAAWKSAIREFNQYRHLVRHLVTDREANLTASGDDLKQFGITHRATPADRHCKFGERHIQTLKQTMRCLVSSMRYELPPEIEGQLLLAAAEIMNRQVRGTSRVTSHEMMRGKKPSVPTGRFGQVGLFYGTGTGGDNRAEWGMLVGHERNGNERALRAYIFTRPGVIVSR